MLREERDEEVAWWGVCSRVAVFRVARRVRGPWGG